MFDNDAFTSTAPIWALDDLRIFVDEHINGLLNAAALLGGQLGAQLASTALDCLARYGMPSRSAMQTLDDLLELLMLEHVHDPCRPEAALFAAIDPASPVVEDICLLADGLDDRLAAYRQAVDEAEMADIRQVAA